MSEDIEALTERADVLREMSRAYYEASRLLNQLPAVFSSEYGAAHDAMQRYRGECVVLAGHVEKQLNDLQDEFFIATANLKIAEADAAGDEVSAARWLAHLGRVERTTAARDASAEAA